MLTREEFAKKIKKDIKRKFGNCCMVDELIEVRSLTIKIQLKLDDVYKRYSLNLTNDYKHVKDGLFRQLESEINNDANKEISKKITPVIRKKGHLKEFNLIRKDYTIDLDILYIMNPEDPYSYFDVDHIEFEKEIDSVAFNNLNSAMYLLNRISDDLDIYYTEGRKDVTATILNSSVQKQIQKKLGSRYLFSIPLINTIVITPDEEAYREFLIEGLKEYFEENKDENKEKHAISSKIYRYNRGTIIPTDLKIIGVK